MKSIKIGLKVALILVTLILALFSYSIVVSAYSPYGYRGYGYGSGYRGVYSGYGYGYNPYFYAYTPFLFHRPTNPFLVDRALLHLEMNPISDFDLAVLGSTYGFIDSQSRRQPYRGFLN